MDIDRMKCCFVRTRKTREEERETQDLQVVEEDGLMRLKDEFDEDLL